MKFFLKWFAFPLLIAVLASAGFLFDALIGNLFVNGASFLSFGFIVWTVFFAAKFKDRIKGFIGILIGFAISLMMMLITKSFTANLYVISISALVGVFIGNFVAMQCGNAEKFWIGSVSGIFVGISLSFSGLGIGMNPLASVREGFLMFGIIAVYAILGLALGFFSMLGKKYIDKKLKSLEGNSVTIEQTQEKQENIPDEENNNKN